MSIYNKFLADEKFCRTCLTHEHYFIVYKKEERCPQHKDVEPTSWKQLGFRRKYAAAALFDKMREEELA